MLLNAIDYFDLEKTFVTLTFYHLPICQVDKKMSLKNTLENQISTNVQTVILPLDIFKSKTMTTLQILWTLRAPITTSNYYVRGIFHVAQI